ncbi:MAG: hypothetical protein ACXABO_12505 [Promethearchaeota archaeon]
MISFNEQIKILMSILIEAKNIFLENLEYQISIKERSEEVYKKIPVFTEQLKDFDKNVLDLREKFEKIHLREKYQIIITELEDLIKESKK